MTSEEIRLQTEERMRRLNRLIREAETGIRRADLMAKSGLSEGVVERLLLRLKAEGLATYCHKGAAVVWAAPDHIARLRQAYAEERARLRRERFRRRDAVRPPRQSRSSRPKPQHYAPPPRVASVWDLAEACA